MSLIFGLFFGINAEFDLSTSEQCVKKRYQRFNTANSSDPEIEDAGKDCG